MAHSTWEHDGDIYYTASALGYCPAGLYYDRLGVDPRDPPDNILKRMNESSGLEDEILRQLEDKLVWKRVGVDVLEAEGWEFGAYNTERGVDYSTQVRVLATILARPDGVGAPSNGGGGIFVPSHLDSILSLTYAPLDMVARRGERRVGEVKGLGDSYWNKFKKEGLAGFPNYQTQLSAQMIGAGEKIGNRWMPALFIVGHKDGNGGISEVVVEEVNTPPIPWGRIRGRVLDIERAVDEKVVPVCPEPKQFPCPYFQFHTDGGKGDEPASDLPESEQSLLDKAAAQYELGLAKEKEGKVIKEGASRVLMELMNRHEGHPAEDYRGISYSVKMVVQNKTGAIDDDKLGVLLKTAGITKADIQKPGTVSRYPKVTKL